MASKMPLCHYCQKVLFMIPSKLLHILAPNHASGMAFKDLWGSLTLQLIFYLLAFACKGRIKKLDKACVDSRLQ